MQLAELNIALLRAPIEDPMIAEFANALDEINTLAEASPGFVWRLIGEGNDATRAGSTSALRTPAPTAVSNPTTTGAAL